jgi:hypothetical protein
LSQRQVIIAESSAREAREAVRGTSLKCSAELSPIGMTLVRRTNLALIRPSGSKHEKAKELEMRTSDLPHPASDSFCSFLSIERIETSTMGPIQNASPAVKHFAFLLLPAIYRILGSPSTGLCSIHGTYLHLAHQSQLSVVFAAASLFTSTSIGGRTHPSFMHL